MYHILKLCHMYIEIMTYDIHMTELTASYLVLKHIFILFYPTCIWLLFKDSFHSLGSDYSPIDQFKIHL